MNNVIQKFLKQTIDRFDELERKDRNFSDVYEIDIIVYEKELKSEAFHNVLATVSSYDAEISSMKQLGDDLLEVLETKEFNDWLEKRDTYFESFKIRLFNGILYWEELVEVHDDGVITFGGSRLRDAINQEWKR